MGKRITQVSVGFLIFYEVLYNVISALNHFDVLDFFFYGLYQIYYISRLAILLILLAGFVISFIEERGICTLLPMCFSALYFLYTNILGPFVLFRFSDTQTIAFISAALYILYLLSLMARHIVNREFFMIAAYVVAIALNYSVGYFYPGSGNEIAEILYYSAAGVFGVVLYVLQFTSVSTDTE